MRNDSSTSKRPHGGLVYLAAGSLLAAGAFTASALPSSEGKNDSHITPGEDLMREHGVLQRLLLIYDEAHRRLGEPGFEYRAITQYPRCKPARTATRRRRLNISGLGLSSRHQFFY